MIGLTNAAEVTSVVLVHGGFVDGSGWESVYRILKKDGYSVAIVQIEDDILGRRWRGGTRSILVSRSDLR